MGTQEEKTAKSRILDAAIRLFAEQGYAATGMRQIAREAGVSVAMVNYHYGSKQVLLESILSCYFERLSQSIQDGLASPDPAELKLRRFFRTVVGILREDSDLIRIAIAEMPHDMPELREFKADLVKRSAGLFIQNLIPALPTDARRRIRMEIVGPAAMGMLIFHFLMRPVVERAFGARFDGAFYDGYADELADLFLYGLLRQSGGAGEQSC